MCDVVAVLCWSAPLVQHQCPTHAPPLPFPPQTASQGASQEAGRRGSGRATATSGPHRKPMAAAGGGGAKAKKKQPAAAAVGAAMNVSGLYGAALPHAQPPAVPTTCRRTSHTCCCLAACAAPHPQQRRLLHFHPVHSPAPQLFGGEIFGAFGGYGGGYGFDGSTPE